jgi:hypothetical protein
MRLYELLDPKIRTYPLLGHAAEAVESSRLSIQSRTHAILMLGLRKYDHWESILKDTRRGGVITYDALFRAFRSNSPIINPLYTPGDPDIAIIKDKKARTLQGKAGRSANRVDPSMRAAA